MLLRLPPELILNIYKSLPCLQNVIVLRQACRQLDIVYRQFEESIITAQRNRIVQPMIQYYTLLSTLHIHPQHLKLPPHEIPMDWHLEGKTVFTLDIMRHMPYFTKVTGHCDAIAVNSHNIDWSVGSPGSIHGRHNAKLGVGKHSICLTEMSYLILDTLKAEINGVDAVAFWQRLTVQIMKMDLILVPGTLLAIVNGAYTEEYFENHGYPVEDLLKIYDSHGWPQHFDQERGIKAIDAYFARPQAPG